MKLPYWSTRSAQPRRRGAREGQRQLEIKAKQNSPGGITASAERVGTIEEERLRYASCSPMPSASGPAPDGQLLTLTQRALGEFADVDAVGRSRAREAAARRGIGAERRVIEVELP